MIKNTFKTILQSELDNKAVHLLLPMMKNRNKSNYTCSMYTVETIVHHKIVSS